MTVAYGCHPEAAAGGRRISSRIGGWRADERATRCFAEPVLSEAEGLSMTVAYGCHPEAAAGGRRISPLARPRAGDCGQKRVSYQSCPRCSSRCRCAGSPVAWPPSKRPARPCGSSWSAWSPASPASRSAWSMRTTRTGCRRASRPSWTARRRCWGCASHSGPIPRCTSCPRSQEGWELPLVPGRQPRHPGEGRDPA